MSQPITFADAAARFSGLVTTEVTIGDAITELIERAYEMGRWRGMMKEIDCTTDAAVAISTDTEKRETYLDFDPASYDGVIGFRYLGNGYYIKSLVSLYQEDSGGGDIYFIDLGEVLVEEAIVRRYKTPACIGEPTKALYALIKLNPPDELTDETILPIKSMGALKAGILAIAYENVNDFERATAHWQKFEMLMEKAQKQYNGNRKIHIRMAESLRRKPTQFL